MIDALDYMERVYAGVLGKIIGVYLGRPFEGWTYQKIQEELGEIRGYINDYFGCPLVVTDDDLSGTFTFVRAVADHDFARSITAEQIGNTWLNYVLENKSTFWWGGFGNSTEHTAFLRLKSGITAPRSGSMAINGKTVAEQIGAQIFIDAWAMIAPGDPSLAADLAGKAASVSHDGEALYAAQLLAAMEAQAFLEARLDKLFETGLSAIPPSCLISNLIQDLIRWSRTDGDWRLTRERVEKEYGYCKYGGGCHVVPNHAIVILSLLYGMDRFMPSLTIANTSGWDTDCNSGNVGCLLGIKNGLASFDEGPDLRTPVADRLYLSSADGGRCVTDAVRETYEVCRIATQLKTIGPIAPPKQAARFHFNLPGAVQGFVADPRTAANATLRNVPGHSKMGDRSLAWKFHHLAGEIPARISTATFPDPQAVDASRYKLPACPTLFPGQEVRLRLEADSANDGFVEISAFISYYGVADKLSLQHGPAWGIAPGESIETGWLIDELDGGPIAEFGLQIRSAQSMKGTLFVDYVDWRGAPKLTFRGPVGGGTMWRRAWVDAFDKVEIAGRGSFRLSQGRGTGLFMQGSRDWQDYLIEATIVPKLAKSFGLAARVQGLLRYYGLLLGSDQSLRLIRCRDRMEMLAEQPFRWERERPYKIGLAVMDRQLAAFVDGEKLFDLRDNGTALENGGIALICEEGLITSDEMKINNEPRTAGFSREENSG